MSPEQGVRHSCDATEPQPVLVALEVFVTSFLPKLKASQSPFPLLPPLSWLTLCR